MKPKYIWFNPERLEKLQEAGTECISGLDLTVSISPYDLPRAIGSEYREDGGYFDISFDYIDDEPETLGKKTEHGIHVFIGKHSGKILRISIPVEHRPFDKMAIIQLRADVLDALKEVDRQEQRARLNHQAAQSLIEAEYDNLVSG